MLRPATPADLDALCHLEDACFRERRFKRDHVAWILQHPGAFTIVDADGGVRAAVMVLVGDGVSRVLSVAVLPAFRRRGLGRALMEAAEALSLNRGARTVQLEVGVTNVAAIALYRALGYRSDGRMPGYYSWGEDALSMTKPLVETRAEIHRAQF